MNMENLRDLRVFGLFSAEHGAHHTSLIAVTLLVFSSLGKKKIPDSCNLMEERFILI